MQNLCIYREHIIIKVDLNANIFLQVIFTWGILFQQLVSQSMERSDPDTGRPLVSRYRSLLRIQCFKCLLIIINKIYIAHISTK